MHSRMRRKDIFVVDDDSSTLDMIRGALSGAYTVQETRTAAAARAALTKRLPNLVLLSTTLPDAAGLDLLAEIRRRSIVPVVVMTDRGSEEMVIRALELRADAYWRKPLFPERVQAVVRDLLADRPRPERVAELARETIQGLAGRGTLVSELATHLGVGPRRLRRLFLERFGRTPKAYLREVRIAQAQHLLLTTDLLVSAVAARAGFNSTTYFNGTFKRMVGMTPRKFRETHLAPAAAPTSQPNQPSNRDNRMAARSDVLLPAMDRVGVKNVKPRRA
jgi:DNA-binding response OmpR family regulator